MTSTLSRSTGTAGRTFRRAPRAALLERLSRREREVLELMAEGWSNSAIGELLSVELKTVETHVGRVFTKLALTADHHENRRVIAALTFVGHASAEGNRFRGGRAGEP
jgi:DNA-binding NarL/FixJ family response regulator